MKSVLPADLSLPTMTDGLPEAPPKALLSVALLRAYRQQRSLGFRPFLPGVPFLPLSLHSPLTLQILPGRFLSRAAGLVWWYG